MNQPLVKIENGKPMTTSPAIASFFRREHHNVLKAIKTALTFVSEGFGRVNFHASTYQNSQNKTQPCYLLTKSGFAMVALGFTGKEAYEFREAYINKFDEMEAALHEKELNRLEREYVEAKLLPFGETVIRESVRLSDACKYLRILGVHLTLTPGQLKGKIKRGEYEGHQDDRGYWRIYKDELTRLATGRGH